MYGLYCGESNVRFWHSLDLISEFVRQIEVANGQLAAVQRRLNR